MTKALVTGSTGFLGREVVARLLSSKKNSVVAVYRNEDRRRELERWLDERNIPRDRLEFLHADLSTAGRTETARLEAGLRDCNRVFHLAALIRMGAQDEEFEAQNVGATRTLIDACKRAWPNPSGRKVVVASTVAVYPPQGSKDAERVRPEAPASELVEFDGANPYAATKLRMERDVLADCGLEVATARINGIYGEYAPYIFPFGEIYVKYGKFRGIDPAALEAKHTVVHVEDTARALLFIGRRRTAPGQVFDVGEPQEITTREILDRIAKNQGIELGLERGSGRTVYTMNIHPRMQAYMGEHHNYPPRTLSRMGFKFTHNAHRNYALSRRR